MRLISYEYGGAVVPGLVLDGERAVPVADLARRAPRDMTEVIEGWDELGPALAVAADSADSGESLSELDGRWWPPVPRPSKIMGVALNNGALSTMARVLPPHPMLFCYPPSALTGHLRPIEIRPDYGLTHPEPELGAVIGRRTRNVSVGEALDAVFGYTIVDDVTSVDLKSGDTTVFPASFAQKIGGTPPSPGAPPPGFEHGDLVLTYHARSKGTDTFAPCGPWIRTRDEVPDPQALAVTLHFDGELCTEDNTANLVHTLAATIAHASRYFTLWPGDILHIGTAARGKYRLRDIDYQRRSGVRTITIDRIGALTNPVVHLSGE